jgi:hypothetical protein
MAFSATFSGLKYAIIGVIRRFWRIRDSQKKKVPKSGRKPAIMDTWGGGISDEFEDRM